MDSTQYSFIPAFTLGLKDSLSPYSLALPILFLVLIMFFGRNLLLIYWFGCIYFLTAIYVHFKVLTGHFDGLLNLPFAADFLENLALIYASVFLIFGILNLIDWLKLRNGQTAADCILKIPSFVYENAADEKTRNGKLNTDLLKKVSFIIYLTMMFILGGFLSIILQATLYKDYFLTLLSYCFFSGKYTLFAGQSFLAYSVAFTLPMVFLWLCVVFFAKRKSLLTVNSFWRLLMRNVLSVFGLAVSFGMIYYNLS